MGTISESGGDGGKVVVRQPIKRTSYGFFWPI